jgi:hypothetical protein
MNQNPYAPPSANVDNPAAAQQVLVANFGISFDDLASADRWRFVWGFFWRSICVAIVSSLAGAAAGAMIGFFAVVIAQSVGSSLEDVMSLIRILSGGAGLLIGFAALWQLIRWCFAVRWFGHRLRLVKDVG